MCLITPDSSAPIEPVRISIDTGAYYCAANHGWQWGLRAAISASTFFSMVGANSIEEDTRPLLQVKATYMRAICLPFSVSPKDGIGPINESGVTRLLLAY